MRRMVSKFFYAWAVLLRMNLERGVRNEESAKKYCLISPRYEPARTFLLMLFFWLQYLRADCTFETVNRGYFSHTVTLILAAASSVLRLFFSHSQRFLLLTKDSSASVNKNHFSSFCCFLCFLPVE